MIFEDDETLRMYVEESLEHLADIENDLLAIEDAGENIDEDLVNRVFRAAHSIKGGAGFMGLANIKDLSHKMENILGMIRTRELIPRSNIISILLRGFDKLRELISNVDSSNDMDISSEIESLVSLTAEFLPENERDSISKMIDIFLPDGTVAMQVAQFDMDRIRREGKTIYLVEYDLIEDIQKKDKTPLEVISMLLNSGVLIQSKVDVKAVGTLESEQPKRIPFLILFASIIEPDIITTLFEVDEKYVHVLDENGLPFDSIFRENQKFENIDNIEYLEENTESPVEDEPKTESTPKPPSISEKEETLKPIDIPAGQIQTSLRVSVSLLDSLMTLAGELVLSRNQLLQGISTNNNRALEISGQRIDMVTSELQEAIMRTRMQSISNVFNKFPRVVRDLSRLLGKEIDLVIEGKEVELDKTIIEAISDPLTHLIRNSVDHGIEIPEVRKRLGKNPIGRIKLRAFHEAGQVNIEIQDDGKGLDGEQLLSSAIAKGLVSDQNATLMSEKEKMALIFLPGFSTAKEVTDVSGRGVGMDVVKTNLDKLGGIVDIESKRGQGTSFKIKLPLTLAIIPSQIISAGNERYAIPQVNLNELLRIPPNQVKDRIEKVGDADVVRLRGNLLPLLDLTTVLGIDPVYTDPNDGNNYPDKRRAISDRRSKKTPLIENGAEQGENKIGDDEAQPIEDKRRISDRRYHSASAINIAVVSTGTFKYGLVVDQLRDSEEIVVKPLGRHLKRCNGYAGATIMGDGRVALILDVAGLAQMAGLVSLEGVERVGEAAKQAQERVKSKNTTSLLVFRHSEKEQCAVPLSLVERIERINVTDIESVGGQKVIQYRKGSLPLFSLDQVAQVNPLPERPQLEVIIFALSGREVGLMVTPPVDALEVPITVDKVTLKQPGVMGSTIINKYTTMMVDMFELISILHPEWLTLNDRGVRLNTDQPAILFAEDSDFFRGQVAEFLEDDGHRVFTVEDGVRAWNCLEEHQDDIKLVLTDLEMPNMDGFELTKKIKADKRFSHLKVVALTSLADEEDVAKGQKAGIDDYQIKLDRETLVNIVNEHMKNYI